MSKNRGIIFLLLLVFIAVTGYARIEEEIKTTCPDDPTLGGLCSLEEIIIDNDPECRDIDGKQICREWWKREYRYKCQGLGSSFNPDRILAQVGDKYCRADVKCVKYRQINEAGGRVTCRIWYDGNIPGCDPDNFEDPKCVKSDCGDLFKRCQQVGYVAPNDVDDPQNLRTILICENGSSCSAKQVQYKVGYGYGTYTFECPAEVTKICEDYETVLKCPVTCPDGTVKECPTDSDTVTCPDGSVHKCEQQVCNKVTTCLEEDIISVDTYTEKQCIASRDFTYYEFKKGWADAQDANNNPDCINLGTVDRCNYDIYCTDVNSTGYGQGSYARDSSHIFYSQFSVVGMGDNKILLKGVTCFGCHSGGGLTGNYVCPAGYLYDKDKEVCLADPLNNPEPHCEVQPDNTTICEPPAPEEYICPQGGNFNIVYQKCVTEGVPECIDGYHWDASVGEDADGDGLPDGACVRNDQEVYERVLNLSSIIKGNWFRGPHGYPIRLRDLTCTEGSGCLFTFEVDPPSGYRNYLVHVPVTNYYEMFNCYKDEIVPCNTDENCELLDSLDTRDNTCYELIQDSVNPDKVLCSKYILSYRCADKETQVNCAKEKTEVHCNDAVYPISMPDVEDKDYSADFYRALSFTQALNEMKQVFGGESMKCEKGWFTLTDSMSLTDYIKSKLIKYAMNAAFSIVGQYLSDIAGVSSTCTRMLISTIAAMSANSVRMGAQELSGMNGEDTLQTDTYNGNDWESTTYEWNNNGASSKLILTRDGDAIYRQINPDGSSFTMEHDGQGTKDCLQAGLMRLGFSASQAQFLTSPVVMVAMDIAKDIVKSTRNCSTCSSESCSLKYGDYKTYEFLKAGNPGLCHYVGSKCTKKINLGFTSICLRKGYRYCCYNSVFTRILVEEAYKQLGYSWGDYDNANCTGLTFDDLKRLDFSAMDFSEFRLYLQRKMKANLSKTETEALIQQSIQAITPIQ